MSMARRIFRRTFYTGVAMVVLCAVSCHLEAETREGEAKAPATQTLACKSYYWEGRDYSDDVKSVGLSRREILRQGVESFSAFYVAQYTKREGRAPTSAAGSESAELLFLWVKRQDNLRRLRGLPPKDAALVRRLDTALTQMEQCQMEMREAEMMGGTGWLADMRRTGLNHEDLIALLMDSHHSWRRRDPKARSDYEKALHHLEETVRTQVTAPQNALDPSGYQKALAGFRSHIAAFRRLTVRLLPAGILRALTDYLGETQVMTLAETRMKQQQQ